MTVKLCDWCQHAQEDQIRQGKGIIYGNFQHSHRFNLIHPWGYEAANAAFGKIASKAVTASARYSDFGVAPFLLRYAVPRQDPKHLALGQDFRLSGPETKADPSRLMISCWIRSEDVLTRSSSSTKSRPPIKAVKAKVSSAPDIRWLSLPEKIIELVQTETGMGILSQPDFVSFLVAGLGLRLSYRPDQEIAFTIQGYRMKAGCTPRRPNALSDGYPEKFCEVSPHGSFGATADNRTGKSALPETVAFLDDLEQVDQSDPDFASFSRQIEGLVNLPMTTSGAIEGRFPAINYIDHSNPVTSRNELMRRLRRSVGPEYNEHCTSVTRGSRICEARLRQACR